MRMYPQIERGSFEHGFSAADCTQCGKCLAGCEYMDFTLKEAVGLMKRVTAAPQWHPEFAACIRCGKCDHRCPKDAHPSYMQRECLEHKRSRKKRLPAVVEFMTNGMGCEAWRPNFFRDVYNGMGKRDRKILRDLAVPKKGKDVMWVGCGDRMAPRTLEGSATLSNLPKFGGPDDCCGVWAIQGGMWDEGYRTAKRFLNRLKECRFDRLIAACGHCQKVLTRIMPEHLGLEVPFPVISIYEYLLERIGEGSARIVTTLDVEGVISDSCFGYECGEDFINATRDLASMLGMEVSEAPHNRENALCCGYGGLFSGGRLADMARVISVKRKDLKESGKKDVINYCPGCHVANHFFQPGFRSHYLLEKALLALDGRVADPLSGLYRHILKPQMSWHMMKLSRSAIF